MITCWLANSVPSFWALNKSIYLSASFLGNCLLSWLNKVSSIEFCNSLRASNVLWSAIDSSGLRFLLANWFNCVLNSFNSAKVKSPSRVDFNLLSKFSGNNWLNLFLTSDSNNLISLLGFVNLSNYNNNIFVNLSWCIFSYFFILF